MLCGVSRPRGSLSPFVGQTIGVLGVCGHQAMIGGGLPVSDSRSEKNCKFKFKFKLLRSGRGIGAYATCFVCVYYE